ncbi:DUF1330 domain-containing protein [Dactylosporangium maewongense]|uniref:DUF1330 domain-containing protein n=1 Tax=Dactylosporangium maewongense TaxID=634393 RepID=A0ABN2DKF5_9ACTN
MAVNPLGADLKRLMAEEDGQPVVMLNLLRFASGAAERYAEYLRHFRPFAEEVGGQIIYYGLGQSALVAETGQQWDAVLLVMYPNRTAFATMVRNPDYQCGTHLRTESLVEAVLQPTLEAMSAVWPDRTHT